MFQSFRTSPFARVSPTLSLSYTQNTYVQKIKKTFISLLFCEAEKSGWGCKTQQREANSERDEWTVQGKHKRGGGSGWWGGGGNSHQYEPEEQIKRQQKRNWLGIKATDSKNFQLQVQRKDGMMMGSPLGEVGRGNMGHSEEDHQPQFQAQIKAEDFILCPFQCIWHQPSVQWWVGEGAWSCVLRLFLDQLAWRSVGNRTPTAWKGESETDAITLTLLILSCGRPSPPPPTHPPPIHMTSGAFNPPPRHQTCASSSSSSSSPWWQPGQVAKSVSHSRAATRQHHRQQLPPSRGAAWQPHGNRMVQSRYTTTGTRGCQESGPGGVYDNTHMFEFKKEKTNPGFWSGLT